MNKIITIILSLSLLLVINGCTQDHQSIIEETDNRTCVTEPGKAIYPGNEKCCGELKSIFGSELPNGECHCTEKNNNCGGAPICAPCGNNICEKEYSEDKCNCPEDCN